MNIQSSERYILEKLKAAGYEGYLVGGCVRDFLLNKTHKDIDITTNALPNQIKEVFANEKIIDTGLQHGTVTVLIDNNSIEVTTFRIDGDYLDNRHPSSVKYTSSLKEDLLKRDFTINAMAYNEKLIDPYNGQIDLQNRIIRAVGDADKRFKEDSLRIMRALRFMSVLNFEIEQKTEQAMHDNKHLLKNISSERIRDEFNKILLGKNVEKVLLKYYDILSEVIPEFKKIIGFKQHNPHHIYDVYTHSAVAVAKSKQDLLVRLVLMFHDIGKQDVFTVDEKGGHFYGHAKVSVDVARSVFNRLKYDNYTKYTCLQLIELHDQVLIADEKHVKRMLNKLGLENFKLLIEVERGDNFAQHPKHRDRQNILDKIEKLITEIIEQNDCFSLKNLAINGKDLLLLGLNGKAIGLMLQTLLNLVIENKIENDKEALIDYVKKQSN